MSLTHPVSSGPSFFDVSPFRASVTPEKRARDLDTLTRALGRFPQQRAHVVALRWLRTAEVDTRALSGACAALNELPALDRRHLLASLLDRHG